MNSTASTYSRSTKQSAKRQPSKARKRTKPAENKQTAPSFSDWLNQDHPTLPGWQDIHANEKKRNKRTRSRKKTARITDQISTPKFAIYTFVAVLLLGFYVSHVFATQKALAKLEEARRQHVQLTLEYNQKKASFDNLVRPDQVYQRARDLGFTEGTTFGPPVLWKPEHTE